MRYLKRTEADCGLGLGDDQRYIAEGDIVHFDESDPHDLAELNSLAQWTHGWLQVTADGEPLAVEDQYVPVDLETPERHATEPGARFGDDEPPSEEPPTVDSPHTTL